MIWSLVLKGYNLSLWLILCSYLPHILCILTLYLLSVHLVSVFNSFLKQKG